ncbi:hypothetical protein MNV49_004504 [Pseudohyphozyma bogoriensis]|nr:hypothetical protein MNV49_004504 [Pseudohyphozyma bogoriensis]
MGGNSGDFTSLPSSPITALFSPSSSTFTDSSPSPSSSPRLSIFPRPPPLKLQIPPPRHTARRRVGWRQCVPLVVLLALTLGGLLIVLRNESGGGIGELRSEMVGTWKGWVGEGSRWRYSEQREATDEHSAPPTSSDGRLDEGATTHELEDDASVALSAKTPAMMGEGALKWAVPEVDGSSSDSSRKPRIPLLDEDVPLESDAGEDSEEPKESDLAECSKSLKELLGRGKSWVASRNSSGEIIITPMKPPDPSLQHCYNNAHFSLQLISAPSSTSASPRIIAALPSPTLTPSSSHDPPTYVSAVNLDSLNVPAGVYTVEARVDFGWLEGGREGMPCAGAYGGKGVNKCTVTDVGKSEVAAELKPCTDFSELSGFWSIPPTFDSFNYVASAKTTPTFHPYTCSLSTPTLPNDALASISASSLTSNTDIPPIIWLSLHGDSNSRKLYSTLTHLFGTGPSSSFSASPTHEGVSTSIAFRGLDGKFGAAVDGTEPTVVVTWSWWSGPTGEKLERVGESLKSFIGRYKLEESVEGYPRLLESASHILPTRTYISFGSHSITQTTLGFRSYLDSLLPQLAQLTTWNTTRFFTTTHVNSSNIPLDRFPHQDLLRNNVLIKARNEVLRSHPFLSSSSDGGVSESKVMDAAALTRGVTEEWTKTSVDKKGRTHVDAVHFGSWVYDAWAGVIWSELWAAGQIFEN